MSDPTRAQQTARLLIAAESGDSQASEAMLALVYDELHDLARSMFGGERHDHTLQPTALLHEAWMRIDSGDTEWQDRRHFVRVAAKAMRNVLVDHARARGAQKRGGGHRDVTLNTDLTGSSTASPDELLAIHEALQELSKVDEQLGDIVELRVFCGMKHPAIASTLDMSLRSVERSWRLARAWLVRALGSDEAESDA